MQSPTGFKRRFQIAAPWGEQEQEEEEEEESGGTTDLGFAPREAAGHGMFVAGVQGVVGAGDKDLAPLNEAGGQKPRDGAKDHFLNEFRAH